MIGKRDIRIGVRSFDIRIVASGDLTLIFRVDESVREFVARFLTFARVSMFFVNAVTISGKFKQNHFAFSINGYR